MLKRRLWGVWRVTVEYHDTRRIFGYSKIARISVLFQYPLFDWAWTTILGERNVSLNDQGSVCKQNLFAVLALFFFSLFAAFVFIRRLDFFLSLVRFFSFCPWTSKNTRKLKEFSEKKTELVWAALRSHSFWSYFSRNRLKPVWNTTKNSQVFFPFFSSSSFAIFSTTLLVCTWALLTVCCTYVMPIALTLDYCFPRTIGLCACAQQLYMLLILSLRNLRTIAWAERKVGNGKQQTLPPS